MSDAWILSCVVALEKKGGVESTAWTFTVGAEFKGVRKGVMVFYLNVIL